MRQRLLAFVVVLFLSSCDTNKNEEIIIEPPGLQGDTIKLSAKEHTFNAEGGSIIITTEGSKWLIDGCYVDSSGFLSALCSEEGITENYYDFITFYCDSFGHSGILCEISKIETSWFTITRETLQKIVFDVLPNETDKIRKVRLILSDHNYFTSIEIDQLAE